MRGQEGGLPPWKRTWAAALSLTQPRNLHGTFLTLLKSGCERWLQQKGGRAAKTRLMRMNAGQCFQDAAGNYVELGLRDEQRASHCGKLTCAHVFPALVERSNPLLVVHAASMSWSERNLDRPAASANGLAARSQSGPKKRSKKVEVSRSNEGV